MLSQHPRFRPRGGRGIAALAAMLLSGCVLVCRDPCLRGKEPDDASPGAQMAPSSPPRIVRPLVLYARVLNLLSTASKVGRTDNTNMTLHNPKYIWKQSHLTQNSYGSKTTCNSFRSHLAPTAKGLGFGCMLASERYSELQSSCPGAARS